MKSNHAIATDSLIPLRSVLNNAVDAGMCGEPVWSENENKLQPVFWPKDILSPNMMQTVATTTADCTTEGGDKLRGIIAGRRDGVRYIEKHPDEAADITAKA
jgi:NitT/TauT family transport system substrate-binding protein